MDAKSVVLRSMRKLLQIILFHREKYGHTLNILQKKYLGGKH